MHIYCLGVARADITKNISICDEKKKLPIGIQSFDEIRTGGWYYVDKTYFVKKLVDSGKYFFLSRPRRFGKSLFLDTLKQAFLGKKELFEGLYLEKNWDWNKSYPVIHIDFGIGVVDKLEDIENKLYNILVKLSREYKFEYESRGTSDKFFEAIQRINQIENKKVVVLIDEYDKPILDKIEDKEIAKEIRERLKDFYSVLKSADPYLKFVFITGVSKFSKVSLFSGLNQLQDITINPEYATICGYTQKEFEKVFEPELENVDLAKVREWYNGYRWLGEPVYNPFDILLYLDKRDFRPFWFETGTPTFLIKLMTEKRFHIPTLDELETSEKIIGSFDVDFVEPENLLFQTRYLTIKERTISQDKIFYTLTYPNKEVRISLNDYIAGYLGRDEIGTERCIRNLHRALKKGEVGSLKDILQSLFSSIPHYWYKEVEDYESFYVSVVYSFFCASGLEVIAEDTTNRGRIDMTLLFDGKCYIFEFKVVEMEGKGKAFEQIKQKKYWEKYQSKYNEIYIIGIEFSKEKRNIISFEWKNARDILL